MTTLTTVPLREHLAARKALPPPAMRRAIRRAAGITITQLAEELGVSRQAFAFWERDLRRPTGPHLVAYVALLKLLREAVENET